MPENHDLRGDAGHTLFGPARLVIDPDSLTVQASSAGAARLCGLEASGLVGRPLRELVRAETAADWDRLADAVRGRTPVTLSRGFTIRGVEVRLTVATADGRPAVTAVPNDPSAKEFFRSLVENGTECFAVLAADGRVLYSNPALAELTGYRPEDVVGTSATGYAHPDDRDEVSARLAECVARGGHAHVHARFRVKSGGYRTVLGVLTNRLADPAVCGLTAHIRDVTDADAAEAAGERQRLLLRSLIDSLPDLIWYKDRVGHYLGCNTAFERYAGRGEADLVGRGDREAFDWERVGTAESENRALHDARPVRREEWLTYPDGRRVLVETLHSPLVDAGGRVHGVVGVSRDLTERRRLEEQLRDAGKMEAVGRLAGGIAHDFNNLLTAMVGNLSALTDLLPADHPGRELLAATEQAAWRAAELTGQLLGFARKTPLVLQPLDPNEPVRETVALLRRTLDPRVRVAVREGDALGTVRADAGQIGQVLMNLCLNARDAMPDGGTLTVETAPVVLGPEGVEGRPDARPGAFVRLSVADTGTGMTPDVAARAFEPFFTTKEVGKGTGLGLAMVFGIAKQHGGWVECSSAPGEGSRFDLYLPRSGDPAARPAAAPPPAPAGGRERVLVADDEPMVLELACRVLESHGYAVVPAGDGVEAIEAYARAAEAIDLVVLDLTMPRLSGRDALRELRRVDPQVRVLISSGYAPDALAGDEAAVAGFVQKPYRAADLARAVRDALDGRPA